MLESNLTSLDLSRRLCELGVAQKSMFYWEYVNDSCYGIKFVPHCVIPRNEGEFKHYSAFGSSELLTMLPRNVVTQEEDPFNSYRLNISGSCTVKDNEVIAPIRTHIVNYKCDTMYVTQMPFEEKYLTKNIGDENPANALAKMLIYLIENNLI